MCVNLSPRQFQHAGLVSDIARVVRQSGLDPRRLSPEITENVVMHDAQGAVDKLKELKSLGIQLAIDDFGTGYSSLSYLKYFPVDTLKIDRAFTIDIDSDPYNSAIVKSVVALADALGVRVTAEGIETEAERAHLQRLGCYGGQGYLFARPVPPEEFRRLLEGTTARPLAA